MSAAAAELSQLLTEEREAAVGARVERLLELQHDKQRAIDRLRAESGLDELPAELLQRARTNVQLIQHLVQCLRGLSGTDADATYGAKGQRNTMPPQTNRGTL